MTKKNLLYEKVTNNIQKVKKKEVNRTKKVIIDTYMDIGKMIENELKNQSENNFNEADLKKLQKKINKEMKSGSKEIKNAIEIATLKMIDKTLENNLSFYKSLDKKFGSNLYGFFSEKYKGIKEKVEKAVIGGNMYKDKHSLSDRIWKDLKKNQSSIDHIIQTGIKNKEHPLDIAKKLEKFVKPNQAKEFNWSKVYPGSKTKIEYNAIRVARTSINHAHHQSTIESAKKNPLVTHVEWLSANSHGRTCEMCANRDGVKYKIDKVPEDHPNGMCMILEVLPSNETMEKLMDDFLDSNYDDFDEFVSNYDLGDDE